MEVPRRPVEKSRGQLGRISGAVGEKSRGQPLLLHAFMNKCPRKCGVLTFGRYLYVLLRAKMGDGFVFFSIILVK